MKHLEIKTIEHKGVKIIVKINYDTGSADLLEPASHTIDGYVPKNWVFANRGLEYMNGWLIILEAMRLAVLDIKKELENDLAIKSAFKDRINKDIQEEIIKEKRIAKKRK